MNLPKLDQQINWKIPANKVEKLKESNKLTKKTIIAKTLEAFNLKAIYDSFQNTH